MQVLPFFKMHGIGNDYVYVDCFQLYTSAMIASVDLPQLARRIADRHYGVGGDGLVLIQPSTVADAAMRIFNADGSEAEMCGNASRCVAKYLRESGICPREHMTLETLSGIREITIAYSVEGEEQITVNMGIPTIHVDTLNLQAPTRFVEVNMGNPHAVFFRPEMISTEEINAIGPQISTHTHFLHGTNVEFVSVLGPHDLQMRVWERGSGETIACGTGACAAAVAAIQVQKVTSPVKVHLRGGNLIIEWAGDNQPVMMTGTATQVFWGKYPIGNE